MNGQERVNLLRNVHKLSAYEAENVDPVLCFLPRRVHSLALRPQIVVVRGTRGAGKSALFRVLKRLGSSDRLREFFGDPTLQDARWVDGFSQTGLDHPSESTLDEFASTKDDMDLRAFWMGALLRRLSEEIDGVSDGVPEPIREAWSSNDQQELHAWVPIIRENLGAVSGALDSVERRFTQEGRSVYVAYDHLDRIGMHDGELRRRWISTLLALWLSLSNRYTSLRGKVFLREDLFDAARLRFADATKLRPRSVSIEWDVEDLFRVVVRHLCHYGVLVPALRDWLANVPGLALEPRRYRVVSMGGKHLVVEPLEEDYGQLPGPMPEKVQKAFVDRLAGELMGKGVKKGYTYRWIPNHLQDAHLRVVPRSMLCLVGYAAEHALRNPSGKEKRLLGPHDLAAALEKTSQARVQELKEEYPLVIRLENLRGEHVLMEPKDAERLLARKVASEVDNLPVDGATVVAELLDLGVLKRRNDGRIDVPDIYRYGYGIKRKGGVARPR